jgi:hypothetical protein
VGSTDYRWLIAIDTLRNSLVVPGEEARRTDHLLAAALECILPQLEAPRDERESPEWARAAKGEAARRPSESSRDTQEGTKDRSW